MMCIELHFAGFQTFTQGSVATRWRCAWWVRPTC